MNKATAEPEAMSPAEIRAEMDQLDAELARLTVRSAAIHGEILNAAECGDAENVIRLRVELAELPDRKVIAAIRLGRFDVARLQRIVDAPRKPLATASLGSMPPRSTLSGRLGAILQRPSAWPRTMPSGKSLAGCGPISG